LYAQTACSDVIETIFIQERHSETVKEALLHRLPIQRKRGREKSGGG